MHVPHSPPPAWMRTYLELINHFISVRRHALECVCRNVVHSLAQFRIKSTQLLVESSLEEVSQGVRVLWGTIIRNQKSHISGGRIQRTRRRRHMHTHTHRHTHRHAHRQTHTHTMQKRMCTYAHTHAETHVHVCTHTHAHTHIHTHTHTRTHTHTQPTHTT